MPCLYKSPEGAACSRPIHGGLPWCLFHSGYRDKAGLVPASSEQFETQLRQLISAKDGNWVGFAFPKDFRLEKENVDFAIDARGSHYHRIALIETTFQKEVKFDGSNFHEPAAFTSTSFHDNASFLNCRFEKEVTIQRTEFAKSANFYRTVFMGSARVQARFSGHASFVQTFFAEAIQFAGWRDVTVRVGSGVFAIAGAGALVASGGAKPNLRARIATVVRVCLAWLQRQWKRSRDSAQRIVEWASRSTRAIARRYAKDDPDVRVCRVFEGDGDFSEAVFLKPQHVLFSQCDLSKVYLRGANFRGARFLGVNWWQPTLGRNGLRDELLIGESRDGPFRHLMLPVLEETCRNIRVALEDNRDFVEATDFYVGEMEARRAQYPFLQRNFFSVAAAYNAVSLYSGSVARALRILGYFVLIHVAASFFFVPYLGEGDLFDLFGRLSIRAVKVVTLQALGDEGSVIPLSQQWADLVIRVLAAMQIAMVIFAFRAKIKRH